MWCLGPGGVYPPPRFEKTLRYFCPLLRTLNLKFVATMISYNNCSQFYPAYQVKITPISSRCSQKEGRSHTHTHTPPASSPYPPLFVTTAPLLSVAHSTFVTSIVYCQPRNNKTLRLLKRQRKKSVVGVITHHDTQESMLLGMHGQPGAQYYLERCFW